MLRFVRTMLIAMISTLLVAGCKEVVHSNLHERDANEIVAVLYSQGIKSTKEPLKGELYAVSVPQAEFGVAIAMLANAGLPRVSYNTIGDVFPDDSVVGTPFEERARFSYALSQELSQTLTEIEGVQVARVHVVIKERGRFVEEAQPSKASIAIYYRKDFEPSTNIPQIKKLVAFAVPDLAYDDVSVSLFPAGGLTDIVIELPQPALAASAMSAYPIIANVSSRSDIGSLLLLLAIVIAVVTFLMRLMRGVRSLFGRISSNAG